MWMNSFSIIVRYSKIFLERKLKEYNLGFNEQVILMYLLKNENSNQESISKYFMVDKGAIAKTISKLEEKGFIKKNENPNNKRENLITLTQKGKNVIDQMKELLSEWESNINKGLSEDEIVSINRIANKMADNIIEALDGEE